MAYEDLLFILEMSNFATCFFNFL